MAKRGTTLWVFRLSCDLTNAVSGWWQLLEALCRHRCASHGYSSVRVIFSELVDCNTLAIRVGVDFAPAQARIAANCCKSGFVQRSPRTRSGKGRLDALTRQRCCKQTKTMDAAFYDSAAKLVDAHVVDQARQVEKTNRRPVQELVDQRRLPAKGWSDEAVEKLLRDCAAMDSNNFEENVGVGEREARVLAVLSGGGTSGWRTGLGEAATWLPSRQPKAAGSSLLAKLANALALDALKEAGLVEFRESYSSCPARRACPLSLCACSHCGIAPADGTSQEVEGIVVPRRPEELLQGHTVLAGLEAEVVAPSVDGSAPIHNRKTQPPSSNDELRTNLEALERRLQSDEDVFAS